MNDVSKRQRHFLNRYDESFCDARIVCKGLKIKYATYQKWLEIPAFKKEIDSIHFSYLSSLQAKALQDALESKDGAKAFQMLLVLGEPLGIGYGKNPPIQVQNIPSFEIEEATSIIKKNDKNED